jgi:HAAS
MITEYLLELLDELRLPSRRRRRVVAEVEDHLTTSAAELLAGGLDADAAEREAVRRFGPAGELARAFVDQQAALGGKRAAGAACALGGLVAALTLGPAGHALAAQPFPGGLVNFFLAQVALVAGALTLLRVWRAAPDGGPAGARLLLVLRGASVVLACTVATVAYDAALAARGLEAWLALGGLAAGALLVAPVLLRGWRLATASTAARATPGSGDDALSDLEAVALRLGAAPALSRTAASLRAHPWRLAVSVAALAGAAMAVAHGAGEGVSIHHLRGAILAGTLIATSEAALALTGFALLGRFLAIRPRD